MLKSFGEASLSNGAYPCVTATLIDGLVLAAYNKDQRYEFKSKMYNKTRTIRSHVLAVHLFAMTVVTCLLVLGGCKKSGLSLDDLARYPNAIEKESMEQSSPLGIVSAGLVQFTTSDTHDQVLSFYQTALGKS